MNDFETMWKTKMKKAINEEKNKDMSISYNFDTKEDPIDFTKKLIKDMRGSLSEERIERLFQKCACHMPTSKLDKAKEIYNLTGSIQKAHEVLQKQFIKDIKSYKQLSQDDLNMIVERGWGAAGILHGNYIVATKIPSRFHEYFEEDDPVKKAFYYCHCPRVKKELLTNKDIDSIYCHCGGGFYQNIWETITSKPVKISVLKNLFDGNDVCQFKIEVQE
jgi:hypothetical protein